MIPASAAHSKGNTNFRRKDPVSHMRRLVGFFLCISLLIPCLSFSASAAPGVSGECACLYLPQLGAAVVDKNAHRRHPMASTTKIMTALVALENAALDEVVTVTQEAVGVEGSSIYLACGETPRMEDLLYALLLESANDAAAAIAIHVGGSISSFAQMMNDKAKELHLEDTHFKNPHGLSDPEHYTTAYDLARITAAAMENPLFREIVATKHKVIRVKGGTEARTLSNHNRLLRSYEDCVGVKTGFTKVSGRCLVSAAERDGMLLIAVTLDAPDDWRDHTALLDYGFSLYRGRVLDDCKGLSISLPVVGGVSDTVYISARNFPAVVLRKEEDDPELSLEVNHFAVAPIREGQVLGVVRYKRGAETIATIPLLAENSVAPKAVRHHFWDKIKNFLNL